MAGIQALVNQKAGGRQGNPNPTYYSLAATEYGTSGDSSCNSSLGNAVGTSCIFYDVTQGDMDVNCNGTHNCYLPSGTYGVLSTSNSSYAPAFGTTTGWDFATGIGSVNAYNLVNNWPSSTPGFTLTANPTSVTVGQGASGTSTITVTPAGGFTGSVTLSATGLPSGVTATFAPASTTTTSTLTLAASATATTGTVTVTVKGVSGALTSSTTISLTVGGGPALTITPASLAFGNEVEDETSAAKSVTLKNTGAATLNIGNIAASGNFALKTSTKPCGSTLAAGATCIVTATFTPTALGALTGSITITDNATGSPQSVPLTGTGTAQVLLTPTSATFAAQTVGTTSAAKVFTLANKQNVALTGVTIATTGNFSVSTTTCTTSLAAHASCKISVVFKPAAKGPLTGSLQVTDSAVGSPQTSTLKGTGK